MTDLFHFLTDLATNPSRQVTLIAQPEDTMTTAGLTEGEQAAFRSRDRARVAALFAAELDQPGFYFGDPNPDPLPDPDPPPDS